MTRRNFHVARKTACNHGHTHASGAEAKRCNELHLLFRQGIIDALVFEPTYDLRPAGLAVKMGNGQNAKYRPDFVYREAGKLIAEDVKPSGGLMERDFPLRAALFRTCFPEIELRVVK
jgi:hypothetical protein